MRIDTRTRLILAFIGCVFGANTLRAADAALPVSPALAVGTFYLFPDTSLSASTSEIVREGTLLEVLGRTAVEHLDKDQNQQFPWFFVKTPDGREGWVFGDGVAVLRPVEVLPENLRPFQRRPVSLGVGFEDAILWFAAIEGHDSKEYHHAFFGEYYIVATNASGRSTSLRHAGKSAQGETQLRQFFLHDLTGDGKPEIALETARREANEPTENRTLEVFSLQNLGLRRVFSENLTLTDANGLPAPALFKCVDLEPKTIRVEYVDYLPCARYSLNYPSNVGGTQEQCIEFVTYTYSWNARANTFQILYEPTRTAPTAMPLNFGVSVRKNPALAGEVVGILTMEGRLTIIRQFDKISVEGGTKKAEAYLYVRTPDGKFGYVAAGKVQWQRVRHAKILEAYGQKPPLVRQEWMFDFPFVRLLGPNGQMGAGN